MKKVFAVLMAALMLLVSAAFAEDATGVEDGILTVAMECAYAPYNWAQPDDSNGAVRSRIPCFTPMATTL